ncbi:hypothetical protein EVAR_22250_1 [Eumeta japonica]|uniref:Uncharacterized protein n=1 Tax=Eumeta variegata TaxID=151549 RepID=A0A4C1UAI5_EUMVA|nr:hypothetical protein EVAR_22250_1 [Eumeta japonica]
MVVLMEDEGAMYKFTYPRRLTAVARCCSPAIFFLHDRCHSSSVTIHAGGASVDSPEMLPATKKADADEREKKNPHTHYRLFSLVFRFIDRRRAHCRRRGLRNGLFGADNGRAV